MGAVVCHGGAMQNRQKTGVKVLVTVGVTLAMASLCIAVFQSAQSSPFTSAPAFMLFQHFISLMHQVIACSVELIVKMLSLAATVAAAASPDSSRWGVAC